MTTDDHSQPPGAPWSSPSPSPAPDPVAAAAPWFGSPPGPTGGAAGAMPPLPGYPPPPYAGMAPPPQRRSRTGLVVLVVVLALVAGCGVGVVAIGALIAAKGSGKATAVSPSASPTPPRPLQKGDCASGNSTRGYVLEKCPAGSHRVLAIIERDGACPWDTDVVASDREADDFDSNSVCLVSNAAPHVGAPGAGGGVLRPGDCLPNIDTQGMVERPCAAGDVFHRIVAMVKDSDNCKAPAVRSMLHPGLGPDAQRYLCLADGPAIASPGECVAWVGGDKAPSLVPVPCTRRPVLKLMGRVGDFTGCERWGTTWVVTRWDNLKPYLTECYRKLG